MKHLDLIRNAVAKDPRPDACAEDIFAMILDGRGKLFASENAVAMVEDGPKGYLHISICAGKLDEILNILLPQIRQYQQENHYVKLTGFGRFGWLKALKRFGAKAKAVYFEFE